MATKARLTTLFDGDASGVKKASKEARQAVGAYEKETSSIASKVASALGVDADQFSRVSEAAKGAGVKIQQSMAAAGKATDAQLASVQKLATGLGVGLAAAIAAVVALWKSVKEEADFYFSTVEGSIKKSGLDTYKETMKALAYEHRNLAQSAEYISRLSMWWQRARQDMRNYWTELREVKWYDFVTPWVDFGKARKQTREDTGKAEQAAALAEQRSRAEIELMRSEVEVQKIETRIKELTNEARLNTTDIARRTEIIAEVQKLIEKSVGIREKYTKQIYETTVAINKTAISQYQDEKKAVDLEIQLNALDTERNTRKGELTRLINRNTTAAAKEYDTELKGLEKVTRAVEEFNRATAHQIERNLGAEQLPGVSAPITATATVSRTVDRIAQEFEANKPKVKMPIELTVEASNIEGLISSTIDGITSAFANAMTGEEDFGKGMLEVLANLAVQVGEIAVTTGLAVAGIKDALISLDPAIAIAAGAALMAVGKWAGASLSRAASGGGTSTQYGGGSQGGYRMNDFNVQISGQFSFQNGALSAAIDNDNVRKQYIG